MRYLDLERAMIALDELGHEGLADMLRDAMDPLWYALSVAAQRWLDQREVPPLGSPQVILAMPVGSIFSAPETPSPSRPSEGPLKGWVMVAE